MILSPFYFNGKMSVNSPNSWWSRYELTHLYSLVQASAALTHWLSGLSPGRWSNKGAEISAIEHFESTKFPTFIMSTAQGAGMVNPVLVQALLLLLLIGHIHCTEICLYRTIIDIPCISCTIYHCQTIITKSYTIRFQKSAESR